MGHNARPATSPEAWWPSPGPLESNGGSGRLKCSVREEKPGLTGSRARIRRHQRSSAKRRRIGQDDSSQARDHRPYKRTGLPASGRTHISAGRLSQRFPRYWCVPPWTTHPSPTRPESTRGRAIPYSILLPRHRHCGCFPQSLRWRVLDARTHDAQGADFAYVKEDWSPVTYFAGNHEVARACP